MINNGPLLCSLQKITNFSWKKKIWVTLLMCLIFLIFILLCFVLVSHLRIASCSNIAFFMILFRLKCSFDRLYFDEWQFLVQNYRAKKKWRKKRQNNTTSLLVPEKVSFGLHQILAMGCWAMIYWHRSLNKLETEWRIRVVILFEMFLTWCFVFRPIIIYINLHIGSLHSGLVPHLFRLLHTDFWFGRLLLLVLAR